jgi:hypothetical protein
MGYDIPPLSRVKLKILTTHLTLFEWRNIVTHGHLKENVCITILIWIWYLK